MSEDTKHKNTKTQKQDDKDEKKAVEETAKVKVGEKEDKNFKMEKESPPEPSQEPSQERGRRSERDEEKNLLGGGEIDELPEDVKKKLAEKKEEKAKKKFKRKKKAPKIVKSGRAYVKATYNNTIVTLTDLTGNVLSWASAGMAGFKGAKKSTPYAAQIITKIAVSAARENFGLEEVMVFVKGVGTGRESAVRALNANGLNITAIKDITPIPHNGCRPKKPRRV